MSKNLITVNNSEKQKELETKKDKLNELLGRGKGTSSVHSGNSNLALYLGIGGIILLIGGLFLVKLLRKRKKVIK